MRKITNIISLVVIGCFSVLSLGQEIINRPANPDQIRTGRFLREIDPNFNAPNSFREQSIMELSLGILDDVINDDALIFDLTVEIKLEITNPLNSQVTTQSEVLEISYSPLGNIAGGLNDKDVFVLYNVYDVRATILGVDASFNGTPVNLDDIDNIYLNLEIKTSNYQLLTTSNVQVNSPLFYNYQSGTTIPVIGSNDPGNPANEVELSWNSVVGAQLYELQWTWVDNYPEDTDGTSFLSASQIDFNVDDFENNNTSILIKELQYTLPLIYDNGYLLYRIRPVGYSNINLGSDNYYVFGEWSYLNAGTNNASRFHNLQTYAHQDEKNWQIQTSYAEDGKKKDVVSYSDGGLRNRQTVTKINTDGNAIVGEAIYDHTGRPVVEVLPAPAINSALDYKNNFNQNSSSEPYSFLDFDYEDTSVDNCDLPPGQIPYGPIQKGASDYYTNAGVLKTEEKDNFIPNASGFPFSVTQYTNDNTGRIKSKSGVGPDHQLNSGHEMKYYYGTPKQEHLDRMFGNNVGFDKYYKRNIVVDPNGQTSISYIDPSGKTIATALMDASPSNLIALDNLPDIDPNFTTDLLGKVYDNDKDTDADKNYLAYSTGSTIPDKLVYTGEEFVISGDGASGILNITYGLESNSFTLCNEIEQDIKYLYEISIIDECGEELADVTNNSSRTGTYTTGTSAINESINLSGLKTGQYRVSKSLNIDYEHLESELEDYLNNQNCVLPYEAFNIGLFIDPCNLTCDDCEDINIYTAEQYADAQLSLFLDGDPNDPNNNGFPVGSPVRDFAEQYRNSFVQKYYSIQQICEALNCGVSGNNEVWYSYAQWDTTDNSTCEGNKRKMISHFMPGEQYAKEVNPETNPAFSIYSIASELPDFESQLPTGSTNNHIWQHPYNPDFSSDPNHYYEDGEIAYIEVVVDDSNNLTAQNGIIPGIEPNVLGSASYRDPSDLSNPLNPSTFIDGQIVLVEPQFLVNSVDFKNNYQPSWGESLITYHPEYEILLLNNPLCTEAGNGPAGISLSSNSYDSSLNLIDTSIIDVSPTTNTWDIVVDNSTVVFLDGKSDFNILDYDPFFKIDYTSNHWSGDNINLRKDWMRAQLTSHIYDNSPSGLGIGDGGIWDYAFISATMNDSELFPQNLNIPQDFTGLKQALTISELEMFINVYIATYLDQKRKIIDTFIFHIAYQRGAYNGCIGNIGSNDYRAFSNEVTLSNGYNNTTVVSPLNAFMASSNFPPGYCDSPNSHLLGDAARVFLPADLVVDQGSDLQTVAQDALANQSYDMVRYTANCPIAFDLSFFINNTFSLYAEQVERESNLLNLGNIISSNSSPAYSGTPSLYDIRKRSVTRNLVTEMGFNLSALFSGSTASIDLEVDASIEPSGNLKFEFEAGTPGTSNVGTSSITLTDDFSYNPSSSLNWTNYGQNWKIISADIPVSTTVNGQIGFAVLVRFITDLNSANPLIYETVITGTIVERENGSNYDIDACKDANYNVDGSTTAAMDVDECGKRNLFKEGMFQLLSDLYDLGYFDAPLNTTAIDLTGPNVMSSSSSPAVPYTAFQTNYVKQYIRENFIDWNDVMANPSPIIQIQRNSNDLILGYLNASGSLVEVVKITNLGNLSTNDIQSMSALYITDNPSTNAGKLHYIDVSGNTQYQNLRFLPGSDAPSGLVDLDFSCCGDFTPNQISSLNTVSSLLGHLFREGLIAYYNGDQPFHNVTLPVPTVPFDVNPPSGSTWNQLINILPFINNGNTVFTIHGISVNRQTGLVKIDLTGDGEFELIGVDFSTQACNNNGNVDPQSGYMFELLNFNNALPLDNNGDSKELIIPSTNIKGNYFTISVSHGDPIPGCEYRLYLKDPRTCLECIPDTPAPVACNDIDYQNYVSSMEVLYDYDDPNLGFSESGLIMTQQEFCALKMPVLFKDWIHYLWRAGIINSNNNYDLPVTTSLLAVTTTPAVDHSNFISLQEFASNSLGYAHEDTQTIIDWYFNSNYQNNNLDFIAFTEAIIYNDDTIIEFDHSIDSNVPDGIENLCPNVIITDNVVIEEEPEDPCDLLMDNITAVYSRDMYDQYLNEQAAIFRSSYINNAMANAVETLTAQTNDLEYQYTLYYYDQAGNLVQTVPPEGFDTDYRGAMDQNLVASERQGGAGGSNAEPTNQPDHVLQTQYKYNSLNQLVWQQTPDGGVTRFAYDELGRIIASQNEKQRDETITGAQTSVTILSNGITWDHANQVDLSDLTSPTKITPQPDSWGSGAVSRKSIINDGEFSIEINDLVLQSYTMIGLSRDVASKPSYLNTDFLLYLRYLTNISSSRPSFYTRTSSTGWNSKVLDIQIGDIVSIERKGNDIHFKLNGQIQRTVSDFTGGAPLHASFTLGYNRASFIKNPKITSTTDQYEKFSYTSYDGLGRITEAGEMRLPQGQYFINDEGRLIDNATGIPVQTAETSYPNLLTNVRHEVTQTTYDKLNNTALQQEFDNYSVNNTRNRVVKVDYYDTYAATAQPNNSLIYDYDVHGNVKEMLTYINDSFLITENKQYYSVIYDYDLISGNVNQVTYQKDKPDMFIHRYVYDADNRIQNVATSSDGIIWEQDASYEYYKHGPLARVQLGDKKVQGLDYAYTIHGWLKGVNSERIDRENEMGSDSYSIAHKNVAQDAFSYNLHYYKDDYKSLEDHRVSNATAFNSTTASLYNGNINRMVTNLLNLEEEPLTTISNRYQYDQLNRIKTMNAQEMNGSNSISNTYASTYSFDRNGNLSTLSRKRDNQQEFDNFTYIYNLDSNNRKRNNRLVRVDDDASNSILENDIDDQNGINYNYDAIGQLTRDEQEGLNIDWRVDGKVARIVKDNGVNITFEYDPLGNRISKTVNARAIDGDVITTFYIRDASGNVMATYEQDRKIIDGTTEDVVYRKKENHLYGSSRLGVENTNQLLAQGNQSLLQTKSNEISVVPCPTGTSFVYSLDPNSTNPNAFNPEILFRELGESYLENDSLDAFTFNSTIQLQALNDYDIFRLVPNALDTSSGAGKNKVYIRIVTNTLGNLTPVVIVETNDRSVTYEYRLVDDAIDIGLNTINLGFEIIPRSNASTGELEATITINQQDYEFRINSSNNDLTRTIVPSLSFTQSKIGDNTNASGFKICSLNYSYTNAVPSISVRNVDFSGGSIASSPSGNNGNFIIQGKSCHNFIAVAGDFCTPVLVNDTDGDGISNDCEISLGSDPNNADDDGDGIPTSMELGDSYDAVNCSGLLDTDGDGILDFMDIDDDNDGVATRDEHDYIHNYSDPANSTGTIWNTDLDVTNAVNPTPLYNYLDPDDDNDRVPTIYEVSNGSYSADALVFNEDHDNDGVLTGYELTADNYYYSSTDFYEEPINNDAKNQPSIISYLNTDLTANIIFNEEFNAITSIPSGSFFPTSSASIELNNKRLKVTCNRNWTYALLYVDLEIGKTYTLNYNLDIHGTEGQFYNLIRRPSGAPSTWLYHSSTSIQESGHKSVTFTALETGTHLFYFGGFNRSGFPNSTAFPTPTVFYLDNVSILEQVSGDLLHDYIDPDDDNDGYLTSEERSLNNNTNITVVNPEKQRFWFLLDSDTDGIPDFRDGQDQNPDFPLNVSTVLHEREVGDKRYELSNHLGNVLSVISDRKLPVYNEPLNNEEFDQLGVELRQYGELFSFEGGGEGAGFVGDQYGSGASTGANLDAGIHQINVDYLGLDDAPNGVYIIVVRTDVAPEEEVFNSGVVTASGSFSAFFNIERNGEYEIRVVLAEQSSEPTEQSVIIENMQLLYLSDISVYLSSLDYFTPDVFAFNDYYPYGMLLNNRHGSVDSDPYRYAFQGQERDDELKGEGNSYNYTFRMHDPRLGRFFAVDPLSPQYPMLTPYQFASNSVIAKAEIEGLEGGWVIENQQVKYAKGPVIDAYSSREAAEAVLNSSKRVVQDDVPNLVKPPEYRPRYTISQQNERREVLAERKRRIETAMRERELMAQTFSNPGMQIAHGVYVGIPEGLLEVSGMMVIDKAYDAYRAYRVNRGFRFTNAYTPASYTPVVNGSQTYQVGGISRTVARNSAQEVAGGAFVQVADNGVGVTAYKATDWVKKGQRSLEVLIEGRYLDDVVYSSTQIKTVTGLTAPVRSLSLGQKTVAIGVGAGAAYGTYKTEINARERRQQQMQDLVKQVIQNPTGNDDP